MSSPNHTTELVTEPGQPAPSRRDLLRRGAALAATGARWWLREERRRYGGSPELRSARRLAILTVAWLTCALFAV